MTTTVAEGQRTDRARSAVPAGRMHVLPRRLQTVVTTAIPRHARLPHRRAITIVPRRAQFPHHRATAIAVALSAATDRRAVASLTAAVPHAPAPVPVPVPAPLVAAVPHTAVPDPPLIAVVVLAVEAADTSEAGDS